MFRPRLQRAASDQRFPKPWPSPPRQRQQWRARFGLHPPAIHRCLHQPISIPVGQTARTSCCGALLISTTVCPPRRAWHCLRRWSISSHQRYPFGQAYPVGGGSKASRLASSCRASAWRPTKRPLSSMPLPLGARTAFAARCLLGKGWTSGGDGRVRHLGGRKEAAKFRRPRSPPPT